MATSTARNTRNAKPEAVKSTRTKPQPAFVPGMSAKAAAAWDALSGNFKASFVMPSWSRGIITFAVVALLGCGVAMAGSALAAFFAAGAVALGIGAFLTWILGAVAWAIVLYFGGHLLFKVGSYFLKERVDADLANLRDSVAHAFTPNPKRSLQRA